MNAVNSVQLFILVWTCSVCRADDDVCSVSCEDVTGTVGEEVTFTCSVSQKRPECCIIMYKFQYPEKYKNSTICREDLQGSCEQRNNFTCRFTPTTAMTGKFRFFVQTTCEMKRAEFTVDITETPSPTGEVSGLTKRKHTESIPEAVSGSTVACSFAGCFIIIFIIIMMTIIYKRKPNYRKPFQRRIFLCLRHDDDDTSNLQQQSP
ncbi:uncharacterized protein [Chanodichthys erythropterus]|uniref:uncharacterized protein n=1 Tax=Chanodichthys erythropterus TaxID=933992 RepID=UPI00351EF3D7